MKSRLRAYIAVAAAIILITGILPVSAFGEDESSEPSYTVSGLGSPYLTVTVNGKAVTPDSDGCITGRNGDKVIITPDKGYEITEFKMLAQDPVIILNHPRDIWHNGSGYQMLLDQDCKEYRNFNSSQAVYFSDYYDSFDAFEYTIPADADYPNPSHFVYCGSDSISVPAGYYDFFAIYHNYAGNVTDFLRGRDGNADGMIPGVEFKNGGTYKFTITGDSIDISISWTGATKTIDYTDYRNEDGSYSFKIPSYNLDFSITLSEFFYELTEGEGSVFDPESGAPLKFVFKRSLNDDVTIEKFTGASVDENNLEKGVDYTIAKGSVVVEIMPSYLGSLSPGNHTLTVSFSDAASVSAGFKIAASQDVPEPVPEKDNTAPDTGVSGRIWLCAWLIFMASLTAYETKVRRGRET